MNRRTDAKVNPDENDPPTGFGPYPRIPDRLVDLPEPVRIWLQRLDEEDIACFQSLLLLSKRAAVLGWGIKWIAIVSFGAFTTAVTFGEGIKKILAWIAG